MTITFTTPVTGSAQAGLTSPTYTLTPDLAPDSNGRQMAVTALGGTQTGVSAHSAANPFTLLAVRPKTIKSPGVIDNNGVLRSVGRNTYFVTTRKGVLPLAGQQRIPLVIRTSIEVPAGAEDADPLSVQAALSLHIGALTQQSSGIGQTAISAIL